MLDLGCFTGGRLIRWVEKFEFTKGVGIDINPIFKEAADNYLSKTQLGVNKLSFVTGFGESLPFDNNTFDYIISFDVFEHVKNIKETLKECYRVLKSNGKIYIIFPQYYQPFESHLNFVTSMPGIHWLFNSENLSKAYFSILKDRGKSANWYKPQKMQLKDWEKLPTLNGTTVRKFNKLIEDSKFTEIFRARQPIFNDGRRSQKSKFFKLMKYACWCPAQIPIINELFLGKIVSVLKK